MTSEVTVLSLTISSGVVLQLLVGINKTACPDLGRMYSSK